MKGATPSIVNLEAIDALMAKGRLTLRFPDMLEAQYEADNDRPRCRHLIACGLVALTLYNVFLLSDWRLVPDVFGTAIAVRVGVVTPISLLIVSSLIRGPSPFWREAFQACISIIVAASILYLSLISESSYSVYHHVGVILVVLFANVVQRLQFPFAVAASVGLFGLYSGAVVSINVLPAEAATNAILVFLGACVFTLIANYQLERQLRRAYLLNLRDRLKQEELTLLSRVDPLTGLGNRRKLDRHFRDLWVNAEQTGEPVCVLVLDVDHFKAFNDYYGHPAGDLGLKRIATILEAELRTDEDAAFRYGGEEFLVLLAETDLMQGVRIAERIRLALETAAIPHEASPVMEVLTASIGVAAAAPCGTITPDEVVQSADAALYAAKRHGRNQVWPPRKAVTNVTHIHDLQTASHRSAL